MYLLEYASDALIIMNLYLISKRFLIPKVFLPLSNKLMHRFESIQKGNKKKRRRKSAKMMQMPVKRLSSSYFYVDSDSSTLKNKSSASDLIMRKRSSSSETIPRKWCSRDKHLPLRIMQLRQGLY